MPLRDAISRAREGEESRCWLFKRAPTRLVVAGRGFVDALVVSSSVALPVVTSVPGTGSAAFEPCSPTSSWPVSWLLMMCASL